MTIISQTCKIYIVTSTAAERSNRVKILKHTTLDRILIYNHSPNTTLPYLYRLRKHTKSITDTIAVAPSANTTADHMPSMPQISGSNITAPPLNSNARRKDINADAPPLHTAVKNPEHQILIPQKI